MTVPFEDANTTELRKEVLDLRNELVEVSENTVALENRIQALLRKVVDLSLEKERHDQSARRLQRSLDISKGSAERWKRLALKKCARVAELESEAEK